MASTGVGSWPGSSVREAVTAVRDLHHDTLPYLPETPARGPGADIIGRAAGLLVELPVDLQPMGWRLVDRPGRDAARTAAAHTEDLDELAEAYDGYGGRLKVQVCGPWSLGASVWLPRGERLLTDPGARRDVVDSLSAGVSVYLDRVQRLVPNAELVLQVDEPSLGAVLAGSLPTASGYGRVRAIEVGDVRDGLRSVLAAAGARHTVVHCCASDPPIPVLRDVGAHALSVDTTALRPRHWEGLAVAIEAGTSLYAGAVADGAGPWRAADIAKQLLRAVEDLGLDEAVARDLTITPTCGLAGAPSVAAAVERTRAAIETGRRLAEAGR